jgi:gp16 family phage-associated protein
MNRKKKPSVYREKLEQKKLELRRQKSCLVKWGQERGYTPSQMYAVSRRSEPADFGKAYDIAIELGIIEIEGEQA